MIAGSRITTMELQSTLERYHAALDEFSRGDPEQVKAVFSHQEDVTLANPFGPAVRGWKLTAGALDYASSRFRDGECKSFESIAQYITSDLATILEVEHWKAKVGGRDDTTPFTLRVTSTFRLEDGSWLLVHRHADPIATPDPNGPIRFGGR